MSSKTVPADRVTLKAKVDPKLKEILDVLLVRAGLTLSDVVDASVRNFVVHNVDLLSDADRERFKAYL